MKSYILAVERNAKPLDFAALLDGIPGLCVKRQGLVRRVQIESSEKALEEARQRLPDSIRVEPLITFSHSSAQQGFPLML